MLAGTGGTARLTRLIGKAKALEMMVTGELMSFEDAEACNLINPCGKVQQKISEEMYSTGVLNSLCQTRRSRQLETSRGQFKPAQKFHLNITLHSKESYKHLCSTALMQKKESLHMSKSV